MTKNTKGKQARQEREENKYGLREWRARRKQGISKLLPSGLGVKVRQINIMQILSDDLLPKEMQPELTRVLRQSAMGEIDEEKMAGYSDMLRSVFGVVVMHPKVLESSTDVADDENEMGTDEIDLGDALAVLTWANTLGDLQDLPQ